MNFDPPDSQFSNSGVAGRTKFQDKPENCSPLLRTCSNNKNFNGHSNYQNRNNQQTNNFRAPVHNRLGGRPGNRPYQNNNDQMNAGSSGQRTFNRKRREDETGPIMPKRKWGGNKPYYQNANPNHISVQNRINRIRNSGPPEQIVPAECKNESFNDSQDIDATDITVQVVNPQVREEEKLVRFKMILNPKTQAAIKLIQSKRKDKQVVFPFPVTPNVTAVSLNERFTML